MLNNMSDELKGVFFVIVAGTIIILALIANNFLSDYVAIAHGLHQEANTHTNSGYLWVK